MSDVTVTLTGVTSTCSISNLSLSISSIIELVGIQASTFQGKLKTWVPSSNFYWTRKVLPIFTTFKRAPYFECNTDHYLYVESDNKHPMFFTDKIVEFYTTKSKNY